MSPAAMRILREMADDPARDLIREGIRAYCGLRPVSARVVAELIRHAAIRPLPDGGRGAIYFTLCDMSHCYLRRPELADEYLQAVFDRRGPFTVKDDQIVPMEEP